MARDSIWFRIGYALESVRHTVAEADVGPRRLPSPGELRERLAERSRDPSPRRRPRAGDPPPPETAVEALLAGAAGSLLGRLLNLWPGRGAPGPLSWTRAAAAGAGATLVAELLRPVLTGRGSLPVLDDELADEVLAGAGRGLVYAVVLEPRLPGPSPLRGAAYGALEYAVSPWGGMRELLGPAAPGRKIPVLSSLLEPGEAESEAEASLAEHVVFGVALALLYGRSVHGRPPADD